DQVLEALVGVFRGAEAGDLAHGPQPSAVHRGIRAARERVLPGQSDILERRVGRIERGIDTLHRKPGQGPELGLPLRRLLEEGGKLLLLPGFELRAQIVEFAFHRLTSIPMRARSRLAALRREMVPAARSETRSAMRPSRPRSKASCSTCSAALSILRSRIDWRRCSYCPLATSALRCASIAARSSAMPSPALDEVLIT